jgi:suppressor for copper-sensitivity B
MRFLFILLAVCGFTNISSQPDFTVSVLDGGQGNIAVQFDMQEGWKTYYKNPGDAGYPLAIEGADSKIYYPLPTKYEEDGLVFFGYKNKVVFPVKLSNFGDKIQIKYGVCKELCVDEMKEYTLTSGNSEDAKIIADNLANIDNPAPNHNIQYAKKEQAFVLTAKANPKDIFVDAGDMLKVKEIKHYGDKHIVYIEDGLKKDPSERLAKLTQSCSFLFATKKSFEIAKPCNAIEQIDSIGELPKSILPIILIAIIGGLILNFMPCVLPVLWLKIVKIIKSGGAAEKSVRKDFLMTSFGIITSFLLLALALVVLQKSTPNIGWGFLFQEPLFIWSMVVLLFAMALNQLGVFEIILPSKLSTKLASYNSSFASGLLTTLLATPCTAPFVGVAIGFALAKGGYAILAIFAAMGLGLALPNLLFAAFPRLITKMPKPGKWMAWIKYISAAAFLLTALWLATLNNKPAANLAWQKFDEAAISADKTTLVNITASWCLTCKLNEKRILNTAKAKKLFADNSVILMQADYTNKDPKIAEYLAKNGSYAIPFNKVYKNGREIILPTILIFGTLENAIAK